ncbi:MAG: PEP-CTERM sorting domain-containing protein [Cyanobacteria bacterium P01_D01_bin.105]
MKRFAQTLIAATTVASITPLVAAPMAQAAAPDDDALEIFSTLTIDSITAKVTKGINLDDDPTGSRGAFSDFYYNDGVTTIDFDGGRQAVEGMENAYTFGDDSLIFSFEKGLGEKRTNVLKDKWAPSGANGEKNKSEYLGVFNGNALTIDLADDLNYFGMNWGALSKNNTFEFLQVDDDGQESSLGLFNYDKLFGNGDNSKLPTKAAHQGNQRNGYVHFYANETDGLFNRIRVSQVSTSGGGFETDNYSFRFSDKSFDFDEEMDAQEIPEPSALLGLGAVVAGLVIRRRSSSEVAA